MSKFVKIAIDGPASSGKSTVAKLIAKRLGYVYVDTGAMYRAITFKAKQSGVQLSDEQGVYNVLIDTEIMLTSTGEVLVDGTDVTKQIRLPEVSRCVAQVATHAKIREELKKRQIAYTKRDNVIMDGRDIGTNVLPDADFKFFMVADARVRAKRRHEESLMAGMDSDLDALEIEIKARDLADSTRKHDPLKQAEDAILIDTSRMTIDAVCDTIVGIVKK